MSSKVIITIADIEGESDSAHIEFDFCPPIKDPQDIETYTAAQIQAMQIMTFVVGGSDD